MKPGDEVYIYDMYGGVIKGKIISQEQYQKISHWRGTGGATLTCEGSLPIKLQSSICVCPKEEIFTTYNEALASRVMNA